MVSRLVGFSSVKEMARVAVAATLCVVLVDAPLLAADVKKPAAKKASAAAAAQVQGQERVLHALNRLTFGPRPGDVAAVQAMGLNKWIEMQLNPAAIDDAKLDGMLAEYPAMMMPLAELQQKYPGPQMLKQMIAGRTALPTDPVERAMVEDQMAFYEIARKKQEQAGAAAKAAGGDVAGDSMMAGGQAAAGAAPAAGKKGGKRAAGMMAKADAENVDAMMGDGGKMAEKPIPASELAAEPAMGAVAGGYTRADAMKVLGLAPQERMKAVLAMSPVELVKFRTSLTPADANLLIAGLTPQQKETLIALPGSLRMIALESMEARVMRDVYSDRQLEAVMTDFWLNHFNVYVRKNQQEPYLIPTYERETIRPRALGNFEDLLVATAKSPAMLVYLDNFRSVGPDSQQAQRLTKAKQVNPNAPQLKQASAGLNENYGRELMELHTLGVNGGYTQADVTSVAKVFTGWGLAAKKGGGGGYEAGAFEFNERRHEPGVKTVLGKTLSENGEKEGLEVLHMLATSPATAHFISQKLAVRFVSDNPPAALVDKMAASFLQSNGDIKTVLRTMFAAPEFWSPSVLRAKVKTPEEFVISAVRASNLQVTNPQALVQSIDKLGMPLYGMQTPNGYSWMQEGWVSTGALVSRMNFSLVMSANRIPGTKTAWTQLLGEGTPGLVPAAYVPGSAGAVASETAMVKERKLEQILLGQPVSDRTRATVLGQSGDASVTEQAASQFDLSGKGKGNYAGRGLNRAGRGLAVQDDPQAAVMAGLLLGSPEFQRR